MSLSTACTVWQVRPLDHARYHVRYCCRGGPAGVFDLVLTRRSPEFVDLPPIGDDGLALAAAGVIIDGVLRTGGTPRETDLTTLARTDPAFVPELRRRLGAVPQPQ
ncbi:hypothetical protein [Amycolatopsis sp. NPDC049159]|uniref:hypothetical protein n=1 Tax=Amycolatopsis sp. NPDC049159 TaxID=3157210 RepID=UPI0033C33E55